MKSNMLYQLSQPGAPKDHNEINQIACYCLSKKFDLTSTTCQMATCFSYAGYKTNNYKLAEYSFPMVSF